MANGLTAVGRCALTLVGVVCALWTTLAPASCLEAPNAEIQALYLEALRNPENAAALAQNRLLGPEAAREPRIRAYLNLVVAYAMGSEGRVVDAAAAIAAARRDIGSLPADRDRRALEVRIAMSAFGVAKREPEYRQALVDTERYLASATPGTREWVCLLGSRGDLEAELDRPDLAAADQLTAYRVASTHGWLDARMGLALTLATTYRRSGLWPNAEAMVAEVIDYASQRDLTWLLAMAEFTSGQIFVNEGQWDQAFAVLAASKRLALDVGDRLTAAFATLPMCDALINRGRIEEARVQCGREFDTFRIMGRSDLTTDALIYRARIELLDKRFAAAVSTLTLVLSDHLDDVPLRYKPRLFRDRARALSVLGRYREAAVDWNASSAAADALALSNRMRTVAVLAGVEKSQEIAQATRALEQENRLQRERLNSQNAARRFIETLALLGMLVSGVLAYLLFLGRRYRRQIGSQAAVLGTLTHNLADTVMLLDRDQKVQFANRSLRGGAAVASGCPIEDVVPPEVGDLFRRTLEVVAASGAAAEFEAAWSSSDGRREWYEQRATPVTVDGRLIGVTLRATDVTLRRDLDHRLRLQAKVLDTMNEGVIAVDEAGRIALVNAALCALLEWPAAELVGRPVVQLARSAHTGLRRAASERASACILHAEAHLVRSDGSECLVAFASSELTFADRTMLIYVCRDISAQRRIERALAGEASRHALSIGHRLHEGLAQELAGISLLVSAIVRSDGGKEDVETHLANAIGTAREAARLISPVAAANGSLELALQTLMAEVGRQMHIPTQCAVHLGSASLDAPTSDQLYGITQNAVQIATRGGCCSALGLMLDAAGDGVGLTVSWQYRDGATGVPVTGTLELEQIGHRTRLLGGTYGFDDSSPQRGQIAVSIPRAA